MKTTVDLPDPLLEAAKAVAAKDGTTLRALIEEGLRWVLGRRSKKPKPFRLRKFTFRGKGLQPGVEEGGWERISDLTYRGRGS